MRSRMPTAASSSTTTTRKTGCCACTGCDSRARPQGLGAETQRAQWRPGIREPECPGGFDAAAPVSAHKRRGPAVAASCALSFRRAPRSLRGRNEGNLGMITIALVGDVMLGRGVARAAERMLPYEHWGDTLPRLP